jgi:hypothetical protein
LIPVGDSYFLLNFHVAIIGDRNFLSVEGNVGISTRDHPNSPSKIKTPLPATTITYNKKKG